MGRSLIQMRSGEGLQRFLVEYLTELEGNQMIDHTLIHTDF